MLSRRSLHNALLYQRMTISEVSHLKESMESKNLPKTTKPENEVKSLNVITGAKSVIRIGGTTNEKLSRPKQLWKLPQQATNGIREALLSTGVDPKMLQNEADQLSEKLKNRHFPLPTEMLREIRFELRRSLQSKTKDERVSGDELDVEEDRKSQRKKVDKLMKRADFNWKPLDVQDSKAAVVYALARMVPNFAEISRVLSEFSRIPEFSPKTVLDFGCGTGSAFWALNEKFGNKIMEYTLIDSSDAMAKIALDIMRDETSKNSNKLVHPNVNFRRHFLPSLSTKYDIVLAHRALVEIGSHEAQMELLLQLWNRTNRFLILIDDAKQDGFTAILNARDFLISQGQKIHLDETIKLLQEHGLWNEELERIIFDTNISDYERRELIRDKLPDGVNPPTALPPASVFAPCPHDLGCPRREKGTCSLKTKWEIVRADGRQKSQFRDGIDHGSVSYVIMEKTIRSDAKSHFGRILVHSLGTGHSTCDVCTRYDGIQRFTVSKKHGDLYQKLRNGHSGELFPFKIKKISSEDPIPKFE